MGCLVILANRTVIPKIMREVAIVGYDPDHSTELITGQLQIICARGTEWSSAFFISVVSMGHLQRL